MSYTKLMVFDKNGVAQHDAEFHNGHSIAVIIWQAIVDRYYDFAKPGRKFREDIPYLFGPDGSIQAVDNALDKLPIRSWERRCYLWTLDNALAKDFDALATDLEHFEDSHASPLAECNLANAAKRMRKLRCEGATAVGLYHTSVGDNQWIDYIHRGEDEEAEYRPYDINKGTRHWFVEDRMPKPKHPLDGFPHGQSDGVSFKMKIRPREGTLPSIDDPDAPWQHKP